MSVRAAVMDAPGRMRVASFAAPDPEPGALVLRIEHSGICGTAKHTWRGESLQYAGTDHERDAAYPLICGHENVTGVASTFPEALALVRPGGTVIEPGTFVDMGDVGVNPSRDVCTKGATILGSGGETLPQYAPALKVLVTPNIQGEPL